jgi:hypothetical protein
MQGSASGAFRSIHTRIASLVALHCQEKHYVTSVFFPLKKVLAQMCTRGLLVLCVPAQRAKLCRKRQSFFFIPTLRLFHQDCTEILKISWYGWYLLTLAQGCTE